MAHSKGREMGSYFHGETKVGKLGHGMSRYALDLLRIFDDVDSLMTELLAEGIELEAEKTAFTTTEAVFKRKSRAFLQEIGGRENLVESRLIRNPDGDQWWWFIDDIVAEERRQSLLTSLRFGVIAVVILLALSMVYKLFLEPDPNLETRLQFEDEAIAMLVAGEFEGALSFVEKALEVAHNDPDLFTLQGVIHEGLKDEGPAARSFRAAEESFESRESFLQTRAEVYLTVGWLEEAITDIEELLTIEPNTPLNHFLQARLLEVEGKFQEAIASYTRASELAEQNGDAELAAVARILMSQLIAQQGSGGEGQ
jgi:Tfp pilus assembly protein PilF